MKHNGFMDTNIRGMTNNLVKVPVLIQSSVIKFYSQESKGHILIEKILCNIENFSINVRISFSFLVLDSTIKATLPICHGGQAGSSIILEQRVRQEDLKP